MADKIAILIPCYNEEITIGKVIDDFRKELPDADIYVYDNNSSDRTNEIAKEHGAIVKFESRQGKGNVVRSMFREIDADYYIMVDGDDTYPADRVKDLLEPLQAGLADMTVGDRISNGTYGEENKRAFHGFGNNLVRFLIKAIYGHAFDDVMTGYRGFTRTFVKTFPVTSPEFQIETEISIHAVGKRWRIINVPIEYRDRPEGSESKLNTIFDGAAVLKAITTLCRDTKPLLFFSLLSIITFCIALIFGVPVIIEYFSTGLVERFPTAILSASIAILAGLFLTCGIMLDTVVSSHNRNWELKVYEVEKESERLRNSR